jgi:superfamily I DNA/RNA helicase
MKRSDLKFSKYQIEIFRDIQKGVGHSIIDASAGSGKTTTLIESFRYLPKDKTAIALAFNKEIRKELRERSPSYMKHIYTFHSWGLQAIKKRFPNCQIDDYKVINIVKNLDEMKNADYDLMYSVCQAVSFCTYTLMDTPRDIAFLMDNYGISSYDMDEDEFIRIVITVLGKCKEDTSIICFDDMCYLFYVLNLPIMRFDYVFVDEFQDLSKSQLELARRSCKKDGGRIIFAGDKFQDIYKFRGSDYSIVKELEKEETTKTLLLPISYRCPKKVVELVKPWVPQITYPETAKEGTVREISFTQLYDEAKAGCFVISRSNSPLIKICLSFIRQGIPANIKGRDIGEQLISIIKKSKKKKIDGFLSWLEKWKVDESKKLIEKGIKIDNLLDRYECLKAICDECKNLDEVKQKLKELFGDVNEKNVVILGTTHKLKGKETDNVFILDWTFYGSNFGDITEDDRKYGNQENNLYYVALTRCKNNLYLVKKM